MCVCVCVCVCVFVFSYIILYCLGIRGFPGSSDGKESACNVRDPDSKSLKQSDGIQ